MTLVYLATGTEYRRMEHDFKISHFSISRIVSDTCNAMWDILRPIYLKTPVTQSEWLEISKKFADRWQAPNVLGIFLINELE